MTLEQIAVIAVLVGFVVALISAALALYHFWGMITHIRPNRSTAANMLGAFSLLFGALYDDQGRRHRESFGIWFLVALAGVAVSFGARLYVQGAI